MQVELQNYGGNPLFQAFFRDAKLTKDYYRIQSKLLDRNIVPNSEVNNLALACVSYLHFVNDGLDCETEEIVGNIMEEFNEVPVFTYTFLEDVK